MTSQHTPAESPYYRAMQEGRHAARMGRSVDVNPYHPYWPSLAGAYNVGWHEASKTQAAAEAEEEEIQ